MFSIHVPIGLGLALALGAGAEAWSARLEGRDGSRISGTAQVESTRVTPSSDSATAATDTMPDTTPASTPEVRVTVSLSHAPANASVSWYLYSGSCDDANAGAVESIIGEISTYSPVTIDGSGNGTSIATIRGAQMEGGNHYVGILGKGRLTACGNLEPLKPSTGG